MNYQCRGLLSSLLIHTVFFSLVLIITTTEAYFQKPVVIDLSILETTREAPGTPCPLNAVKGMVPEYRKPCVVKKETPTEHPRPRPIIKPRPVEKQVKAPPAPAVEERGPVPIAVPENSSPYVAEPAPVASAPITEGSGVSGPGSGSLRAGLGGGTGGGGGASAEQLKMRYLSEHFAYIKEIIQQNITYPERARKMGWQGKVVASFVILENGQAAGIKIAQSSGFPVLDNNVVATIKEVAPFPKPPVQAELHVPIIYRLQ
jgi:periplasmic protein TonB